ncbi:3-deoxy-manno-octulosonate cytidylyltransferase, partial [bacterium]|nr:3-deoxy-manno-octulosonate cytidylyltransferase [bacterium]
MVSALIIPARMSSSRFPNKPMAKIKGIPMIGHCYLNSVSILGSKNTFVATCDKEIKEYIISIGGNVIMTSKDHNRATTRVSEALIKIEKKQKKKIHNILMHQGDEPLIKKNSI